jgi:hypothetical protein
MSHRVSIIISNVGGILLIVSYNRVRHIFLITAVLPLPQIMRMSFILQRALGATLFNLTG